MWVERLTNKLLKEIKVVIKSYLMKRKGFVGSDLSISNVNVFFFAADTWRSSF